VEWTFLAEREEGLRPGRLLHPLRAYVQALWVMVEEYFRYVSQLRRYLSEHPAVVWLLGFRLHPHPTHPDGFDLERSLPSERHLRRMFADLPPTALRQLLEQTVRQAVSDIPDFGQLVSIDSSTSMPMGLKTTHARTSLTGSTRPDA
jgi:hypothetical protein